jgi:hypothetical protein
MTIFSRYSCRFDHCEIVVDLLPHEIERAREHDCPDVAAAAYALRRAYAQVPDRCQHYSVTPVQVN